jgi:hypothetical protein
MQAMDNDKNNPPKAKDRWDKMQALGMIMIPLVLAVIGLMFSSALKERELRAQYVKLATDLLTKNPEDMPSASLRLYAFNILNELSPVPMPPGVEVEVMNPHLERDRVRIGTRGFGGGCLLRLQTVSDPDTYVYLDGHLRAMTPVTLECKEGRHAVEFRSRVGVVLAALDVTLDYDNIVEVICNEQEKTFSVNKRSIGAQQPAPGDGVPAAPEP